MQSGRLAQEVIMRTPQTHHRFVATPIALENSNSMRPVGLDGDEKVRVDKSTHVDNRTCYSTDASPIARYQVPQLRTLLVPLDGSPFAERALPFAAKLACRAGAELRIVHVDSTCGSH